LNATSYWLVKTVGVTEYRLKTVPAFTAAVVGAESVIVPVPPLKDELLTVTSGDAIPATAGAWIVSPLQAPLLHVP
jgi:hypothetical protein